MTANSAYKQYRDNSIQTASPEELTLMLYNGIVRFIMQAQRSIDENDLEKTHSSILRAQDIIMELKCTLNMKYGISHSLSILYDYLYRRLVDANVSKDKEILEEVLGFAKELRDTWTQAMKTAKCQEKPQQIAR
ncbi:MAG: flagellar export chaperone FliS [Bacillota bacterium]|nr:flagellar export chaperone FliS [Bacillota bacterium]